MKKILFVGALALLATVSSQQQASAWLNFKFGAGVNWVWQSGGNNFLWGLFRNGQPPGFGPQYDPSVYCNQQGCGLQGPGPFGMQQFSPYMMQPGYCPQGMMQQGPTLPAQGSTGQTQGQFPNFPGIYPYAHDQFQFFGSAPAQPGNGNAADANAQAAAQNKNWHTAGYTPNPSQNWSSQYRPGGYYPYYYPGSTSYYPTQPYYSQSYYGYGYRY